MKHPLRIAFYIDTGASLVMIFLLLFRWFQYRSLQLYPSALLASVLCLLLLYAFFLYRKKLYTNKQNTSKKTRILYALTMMDHDAALRYAAEALADKYHLILLDRFAHDGGLIAFDKNGYRLSIDIHNAPTAPDINVVHALHRRRSKLPAVLVCTASPSDAVQRYAQTLSPALRLIGADSLPLDTTLAERFPMPNAIKKKRTALSLLHNGTGRAMRCMLFSFGMIIFYLITGRRTILYPSLALCFLSVIIKTNRTQETLF